MRAAAKDFADVEDVVDLLRGRGVIEEIEDARDAERAVKDLAKRSPHLLRRQESNSSGLERVLENGRAPEGSKETGSKRDDGKYVTREELQKMSQDEVSQLIDREPEVWARSIKHMNEKA